ncbi:hypothetical protein WFK94_20920 [Yersinia enterocolitica]
MSRYILDGITSNGCRIEILLGWDRVLDYFFLVIEPDRDPPLYSNLDENDFASLSLEYFQSVLDRFGVTNVSLNLGHRDKLYEKLMKESGRTD